MTQKGDKKTLDNDIVKVEPHDFVSKILLFQATAISTRDPVVGLWRTEIMKDD